MKTSQVKFSWARVLVLASLAGFAGGSFAFGADFSAKSDSELIKLAGAIAPSDEPDFAIEVNKRINAKPYGEAKDFKRAIKNARHQAFSKLSTEQAQKRNIEICKAFQAKTDSMTGAQIREAGLKVSHKNCDFIGQKHKHDKHDKVKGFRDYGFDD